MGQAEPFLAIHGQRHDPYTVQKHCPNLDFNMGNVLVMGTHICLALDIKILNFGQEGTFYAVNVKRNNPYTIQKHLASLDLHDLRAMF